MNSRETTPTHRRYHRIVGILRAGYGADIQWPLGAAGVDHAAASGWSWRPLRKGRSVWLDQSHVAAVRHRLARNFQVRLAREPARETSAIVGRCVLRGERPFKFIWGDKDPHKP